MADPNATPLRPPQTPQAFNTGGFSGITSQGGAYVYRPPEEHLVSGQLRKLQSRSNPLVEQARRDALRRANARGDINASYAAGSAENAAFGAMLPVAQQDSATLTRVNMQNMEAMQQGRLAELQANANAGSAIAAGVMAAAERDNAEQARNLQLQLQRERLGFEGEQAGYGREHDFAMFERQLGRDLTMDERDFIQQMALGEQGFGFERELGRDRFGQQQALAEQGFGFDLARAEQGYGFDLGRAQQAYGFDLGLGDQRLGQQLALAEQGFGFQRQLGEDEFGRDIGRMDRQAAIDRDRMNQQGDWQARMAALDFEYGTNEFERGVVRDMMMAAYNDPNRFGDPQAMDGMFNVFMGSEPGSFMDRFWSSLRGGR